MKTNNRYLKAGSFYLLGNIFNKGIAFLTVPIYTRILSAYDYGIVNTYLSWVGILSIILGMTLHMGVRAAFSDYKDDIDVFMSSITSLSLLVFSVIFAASMIILYASNFKVQSVLIVLCLLHGFSTAIIKNYSMYLMMKFEYKRKTIFLVLPNLISNILAVLSILFIFESGKYMGKILPSSIVYSLFALIIIAIIYKSSTNIFLTKYWRYALSISLPIIFHGLSLSILSQSDRIILTSIAGATETGIYSLVYNFSMIVIVVITSIEGVWVPWFTKKMKTRHFHEINQKVKLYIWIMTYIISCILLISPEILVLLAPKEYWIGRFIIPPIVVSSFIMFIYTIYVNVEHYYKKTKYIAVNTIIAAFSNVVLNIIFIPMYGMYAAATTTLVSYFISLIMHYKYSRSIEKDLFPIKIILIPLLLLVLLVIAFYLMLMYPFIRWSILFIFTAIFILIWKKEIKSFIDVKN